MQLGKGDPGADFWVNRLLPLVNLDNRDLMEIERLKALLVRAADELQKQHGHLLYPETCPHCVLIAELRKAAQ